ncbi:MAG TPA: UMP kinase, partial [Bacillota bacterium]|nr:UMP kinase [Bacillota bacterium]
MMESKYKRVILKISGEALAGEGKTGIDQEMIQKVAGDVGRLVDMGVQVAIVVGGGNFWRGRSSGSMDRVTADYMGMLATCINALALRDAFENAGIPVRVQTAIEMRAIAEPYIHKRALSLLDRGIVVIFAAGTGCPFFSTDTTTALRAAEINAEVILLAKKVDAVYDSDPELNPNAKRYKRLTHTEVLEKNLKVMDSTAAAMCRDNKIMIHVFGVNEPDGIIRACAGEDIG